MPDNVLCEIDWTAIGTWALAIIAFVTIRKQQRQFNKQRKDENERAFKANSLTAILEYDSQFQKELAESRRAVAKLILKKKILTCDKIDYNTFDTRIEDIFDFFDTVGFLVVRGYIKEDIAHQYFHHWFSHYYKFSKLYNIREAALYPKTVWCNMEMLSERLERIETNMLDGEKKEISKEDLQGFFEEESET